MQAQVTVKSSRLDLDLALLLLPTLKSLQTAGRKLKCRFHVFFRS